MATAEAQLEKFLSKYTRGVSSVAREALQKVRSLVPGACELVYDNYNALAIGFAASERASDAVISIAVYPRWVSLFFLHGATLPDPKKLLRGSGKRVRHIVLENASDIDKPAVRALIKKALAAAETPIDPPGPRLLVIKSVSAKQRPRK